MPAHSSHAQVAARFFGCALLIVPLTRGDMSFRPRMDFDGQNHAGRPSGRAKCVISPWDRLCVDAPLWSHENAITFPISLFSCHNLAWRCHEVLGHIRQSMSRSKKDHQYNFNEGKLKKVQTPMYFYLNYSDRILITQQRQVESAPVLQIIWAKFPERSYWFRFMAFKLFMIIGCKLHRLTGSDMFKLFSIKKLESSMRIENILIYI